MPKVFLPIFLLIDSRPVSEERDTLTNRFCSLQGADRLKCIHCPDSVVARRIRKEPGQPAQRHLEVYGGDQGNDPLLIRERLKTTLPHLFLASVDAFCDR